MKNSLKALFALAICAIAPMPARAQEGPWRVTVAEGVVRIMQPGRQAAAADLNAPLSVGAVVTTGVNSRATIENGAQRIMMTANSRMTIAPDEGGLTRILQDLGAIIFEVDHRQTPHFRVDTRLLAALVKGTTFSVTVGAAEDEVHVTQGLLEVRALTGGAGNDVASGMTVHVTHDQPAIVAPVTAPAANASALPPLNYSAVSDGLLNENDHSVQRGAVGAANRAEQALGASASGNEGGASAQALAMTNNAANGAGNVNGAGNGVGAGNSNGVGAGNSNGVGAGNSNGAGVGAGNGLGSGAGNGVGSGAGVGNGNGTGNGAGNGSGAGAGAAHCPRC